MLVLNATHRCDRCGAQAYHRASKTGFEDLHFCNHHARDHRDKLRETYWLIESDRAGEQLAEPVPAAANTE